MTDEPDSVLGRVRPHGLSPEDVAAYDLAVGAINRVIAVYTGRIHEHHAAADPDPDADAALRAERDRYVALRGDLRPDQRDRVAQVRRECAEIIRDADRRLGS